MGSNQQYPEITGHISTRNTEYYHMVINAGFLPDKKRNRISASTGLPVKGNQRKAAGMLNDTIHRLQVARRKTGVLSLKELYRLIQDNDVDDLEHLLPSEDGNAASTSDSSPTQGETPLFTDVIDEWLEYHSTRIKGNTAEKYRFAANHIKQYFKGQRIGEITPRMIAKYFPYMTEGDVSNGIPPLSASTLADHRSVINMSMRYAKRIMGVITDNPAEEILSPKKEYQSPEFFKEEELNQVFRKIMGHPIAPAIILAGAFGLRRQEAVGMKWNAIDFEDDSVTIQHTVTMVGSKEVEADTAKSKSSFRTLILLQDIKPYFVALKEYHKAACAVCGRSFSEDSYICVWPDGSRLRVNYVSKKWKQFLTANGMKQIRYHDLRHSSASLLLRSGLSLVEVKDWLGHADIKTTARYAHLGGQERQQRVADKIGGKLHIPVST